MGVVLTITHIILLVSHGRSSSSLLHAYVISDNDTHELRLSHATIYDIKSLERCILLRNSVVDPITGSTHLKLLKRSSTPLVEELSCIDVILPANGLSVSLKTHVACRIAVEHKGYCYNTIEYASANGFVRGCCIQSVEGGNDFILKFSIDATGERCVGVVGESFLFNVPIFRFPHMMKLDAASGRICYVGHGPYPPLSRYLAIVSTDDSVNYASRLNRDVENRAQRALVNLIER